MSTQSAAEIGQRIKALREELGITRHALGQMVLSETQYPVRAVYRWESGQSKPDAANLVAIAKALGTTPNHLLGFEDQAA